MSEPILEEQLFNLSPKTKIIAGASLGVAGIVACILLWEQGWIAGAAVFAALIGPILAVSGRRELARAQAFDAEVERARGEWSELERGIRAARQAGKSVARFLQDRGYREYHVRSWIAGELDPGKSPK